MRPCRAEPPYGEPVTELGEPNVLAGILEVATAQPAGLGPTRLVTIDGPSGAGKTTLAAALIPMASAAGWTVTGVALEELYEGWQIDGAWQRLDEQVLGPVSRGEPGRIRRYDWTQRRFGADVRPVPVTDLLVVEGCGAGCRAADAYRPTRVWVQAPPDVARDRGLARDGAEYADRLRDWAALERAHFAAEATRTRADVQVDTTADRWQLSRPRPAR